MFPDREDRPSLLRGCCRPVISLVPEWAAKLLKEIADSNGFAGFDHLEFNLMKFVCPELSSAALSGLEPGQSALSRAPCSSQPRHRSCRQDRYCHSQPGSTGCCREPCSSPHRRSWCPLGRCCRSGRGSSADWPAPKALLWQGQQGR